MTTIFPIFPITINSFSIFNKTLEAKIALVLNIFIPNAYNIYTNTTDQKTGRVDLELKKKKKMAQSVLSACNTPTLPPSSADLLHKNFNGKPLSISIRLSPPRSPLKRCLSGACRASMIMMPIGVPIVPYKIPGGGWQWLDLNNALYRDRIICISQFIDEGFSNAILGTLLYLDSVNSSEVLNILIMGQGGNVSPSLQIYDTMESLSSPISTAAMGYLCNLSGYILAAGDKGKRYAMPMSVISFEPIAGAARGQADDIINEANELVRIRDYLFKQMALKTGQPLEKIKKDFEHRKLFFSQEALEYGLIDQIVRPPRIKASLEEKTGDGLG